MNTTTADPMPSALGLRAFEAWVRLTREPFDSALHEIGARNAAPLRLRLALRMSRRLLRWAPFFRLVPRQLAPALSTHLPRRIWIYWEQGVDAAPDLVRFCIQSWREKNPGWEVICLDARDQRVAALRAELPSGLRAAHLADILRLELLSRHGGVWIDASLLCLAPLDDWLPARMRAGFFACFYSERQADRPLANWFLAAAPGGYLVDGWRRHARAYWARRETPVHYFVHHYLFDWMIGTDREAAALWRSAPMLPAGKMHVLQSFLRKRRGADDACKVLSQPDDYVMQKLDWRLGEELPRLASIMKA